MQSMSLFSSMSWLALGPSRKTVILWTTTAIPPGWRISLSLSLKHHGFCAQIVDSNSSLLLANSKDVNPNITRPSPLVWVWVWVSCYDRRSVSQSVLEQSNHLGLTTRSLLLSNSCRVVDVRRSLWREDGCRLYLLLAFASTVILGSESRATSDHILLFQIRDFPFCRLLRLAGSRWRYSIPPPHGISPLDNLFLSLYIYIDI
jgi:hypothetical protein